jgi:hypothetical protein
MASDTGSGGNTFLGFMVGGLIVVVAIIGFFMFTGGHLNLNNNPAPSVNLNVHTPAVPKPSGQ